MHDFASFFVEFRKRPSMYMLNGASYDSICAYLSGYDLSSNGLTGFHEFLVVKVGHGDNLVWEILVLELAHPGFIQNSDEWSKFRNDHHLINVLFDLVEEFLAIRHGHEGLRCIFAAYEKWKTAERIRLTSLYPNK